MAYFKKNIIIYLLIQINLKMIEVYKITFAII